MVETISRQCICYHFMSVKVALCSISLLKARKNNEESACQAILHPLLVKGRIISVDAIESPSRVVCAGPYL
jgi:hypothetical protein